MSAGLERMDTFIHVLDGDAELLVGASGRRQRHHHCECNLGCAHGKLLVSRQHTGEAGLNQARGGASRTSIGRAVSK
jgi:hypothetical protein